MKKTSSLMMLTIFSVFLLAFPPGVKAQKEGASTPQEKKQRAAYYDFDDILIPAELNLDKKNSFVYGTPQSKVGILVFGGRVEPSSLAVFFQNNMQKDGWRLLSSFKYREYMMLFLKEDRTCVITITEKSFSTNVELWVGPIEPVQTKGPQTR